MSEGIATADPTSELAPMRRVLKLPTVLSVAEVNQLLSTAHALADQPSHRPLVRASYARRAALLETLYASGMLISEAVRLPARAAQTNTKHLLIVGKGDKERIVPLHDKALIAISRWRRLADEYGYGMSAFSLSSRRGQAPDDPVSRARDQERSASGRLTAGRPNHPTCAQARLRHPPTRQRGGLMGYPSLAWPSRSRNHRDLHAFGRRVPAKLHRVERTLSRLPVHWAGRLRQSRNLYAKG